MREPYAAALLLPLLLLAAVPAPAADPSGPAGEVASTPAAGPSGAAALEPAEAAPPPTAVAPDARLQPAPPDLSHIVQEARRVQFTDLAAWSRFRFRRHVEQERLGPAGEVRERSSLEFLITPVPGAFDEILVRLEGREPTPKEVVAHRRRARFSRHYAAARAGGAAGGEESGYSLAMLLRLSSHRYAGQEMVEGVLCHRLDFEPGHGKPFGGIEGKLAGAMAGSLWITADGYHLARAVAHTVRPVPIALSIAKVYDLEVSLESMPVARGIWVPRQIEVRADARAAWVPVRKRTRYTYSDFQPVFEDPGPGGARAVSTSIGSPAN